MRADRTLFWRGIVRGPQRLAQQMKEGLQPVPVSTRLADFAEEGAAICDTFGLREEFVGGLKAMERERAEFAVADLPQERVERLDDGDIVKCCGSRLHDQAAGLCPFVVFV